ncbi:MAG: hypothetical protein II680_10570, partial [Clostridia bacterium]|nr:hypothetical protein [Clostridia bacterium]
MKRMNMKSLSLALTVLLMAGSLPGCGESAVQNSPDETVKNDLSVPSAEAETVPETEETVLSDSVPELDFGGVTVTMAGQGTLGGANDLDIWVPELTGDVVRDAVFQRNIAMEERFNVSIAEPLMNDYTTISNAIKSCVRAGDSTYDFVANQLAQTSADVM